MDNKAVLGLVVVAAVGYYLYLKTRTITADYTDPAYMWADPEVPEVYHSTDDFGGTMFYEQLPIAVGPSPRGPTRKEEEEICRDDLGREYPCPGIGRIRKMFVW